MLQSLFSHPQASFLKASPPLPFAPLKVSYQEHDEYSFLPDISDLDSHENETIVHPVHILLPYTHQEM